MTIIGAAPSKKFRPLWARDPSLRLKSGCDQDDARIRNGALAWLEVRSS
ncbi:MAG: hypothetical protein WCF26_00375 [Candidatus Sulfotelmatobacter sp.]